MPLSGTSIQKKLTRMILFTCVAVLLLTGLGMLSYELLEYKRSTRQIFSTLSEMAADTATTSLIFNDPKVANEILYSLRAEQDVRAAALYTTNGELFATFPADSRAPLVPDVPGEAGARFEGAHLTMVRPVYEGNRKVGTLYLRASLRGMYRRMGVYSIVLMSVVACSIAVAFFISSLFQRRISQPILDLTRTAQHISKAKDYSVRARKTSQDELGYLTEAFNAMLDEIQSGTLALRQSESRLRTLTVELEQRVAERTARLREMVAELETFSYSISHDMRAPLRAMQGFSQVLIEDYGKRLEPQAQALLQRIMNASRRLDSLIQDILSYSRAAREDIRLQTVDLQHLVDETITQFQMLPVTAHIHVDTPLPLLVGHEASLSQVLTNLLSNAVKFVPEGRQPHIRLGSEDLGDQARIYVEDNGIGIAKADLHRVFNIFERVHNDGRYEGSGIGLSIVKRAIERMGGRVGLQSELGKGTRFWFQLKKAV